MIRLLALCALTCGCLSDPASYAAGGGGNGGAEIGGNPANGAAAPLGGGGGGGEPTGGRAPEELNVDWVLPLGTPAEQGLNALAVGATGHIFVGGQWTGDFEQTPLNGGCQGQNHAYVQAIKGNGDPSWLQCFGGAAVVEAIDVNDDGYVAAAGSFENGIELGSGVVNSSGQQDIFVVVLAPDGSIVWGRAYGSPMDDRGLGVAIDENGLVYLSGSFRGVVSFDGQSVSAPVGADLFLTKIDGGTPLWVRQLDNGGVSPTLRIAVRRGAGEPIVGAGSFEGVLDRDSVGPAPFVTAVAETDAFTIGWDSDGMPTFFNHIKGTARQDARSIQASTDSFVVSGDFAGTVDFDDDGAFPEQDSAEVAAFALSYDFDGVLVALDTLGGTDTTRGLGLGIDRDAVDEVCLVGNFEGALELSGGVSTTAADDTNGFLQCYSAPGPGAPTSSYAVESARGIQSINRVAKYGPAILLGGTFQADLELGDGYSSKGGNDVFIAKLAPPL